MKKHRNWKGLILIAFASIVSAVFPILAYVSYTEKDMASVWAFIFGAVITIVIFAILVPGYYKSWRREVIAKNMYNELPDLSAEVFAISKSKKTVGNRFSTGNIFYVGFEFSDGERKNFRVSHDDYALIEKGEKGQLTYKESGEHLFFVKFKSIRGRSLGQSGDGVCD